MNDIVNKFLLAGDNFVPEMHLKQPGFTYSSCGPFTKKFMQTGNTNFIYRKDLDKASLQHDMAYGKYKDLTKRTESDKVLRDKAFKIATNRKYYGYEWGLASMVYKFLANHQLADELCKPIIGKFKRCKIYSFFKGNTWESDVVYM